jgi:predicted PurR-regulated permease PerM
LLGIDPKAARYTWTAAAVLLLIGLVYLISGTLLVFITALLLAYLLYPLMDLIDRHMTSKTRTPALVITYLLFIGLLVTFLVLIGIRVADQATSLAKSAPAFLDRIQQPPPPGPEALKSLRTQISGAVQDELRKHYSEIVSFAPKVTLGVLSASRNLIYIFIVPILSFFILRDGRSVRDSFLEMFDGDRQVAREILMDIHTLLLQYMRALLFLCCNTFVVFSIALSAMGVPYALLLASTAFPLEFIPLVGPLAAAAIILFVSVVAGFPHVLWVVIFLGVFRIFQDYVLSPKLMSRGVELHPLLVIFGVFAGGEAGGVAGVFLSVPALALIRMLYHRLGKTRAARRVRSIA